MMDLLVDSIVTCQVSARHMRLKCMTFIVDGFDSSNEVHMVSWHEHYDTKGCISNKIFTTVDIFFCNFRMSYPR